MDQPLDDLNVRARQLEKHLLRSPEYLSKADRDLKRQVVILYLAIALLLLFEGTFVILEARHMPDGLLALIVFTSVLAIVNCLLLIRTKTYLHRLNEGWLDRDALRTLEKLRAELEQAHRRGTAAEGRPSSAPTD